MKKYLALALTIVFYIPSFSQEDKVIIQGTTKINKNLAPQVVIDSLNKTFPDAQSVKYFKTPPDAAAKGWTINKDNELQSGETIDYYTISFKRANMQYYGLYTARGRLLKSKLKQNVTDLPDPIKLSLKSIGKAYPGYTVKSKTYYKNTDHSDKKEYYEIVATNGKETRRLFYEPDGTLAKVK